MTQPHPADDRCFYCASDDELQRVMSNRPAPVIHMDSPPAACPHWSDPDMPKESA